ncbi:Beta-lactamase [Candidatus Burkholderia humilis]|nr:Beta-lactamase [Candidatus Burkholderia humilis]
MDGIHGFLERRFPGTKTPGYTCAVVIDGNVVLERTFCFANLEWDVPTSKETVFHIGSESKQFTAYLVTKLIVDGRLRLDDDARDLLEYCRTFRHPLRIEDLLRHTSGVADYLSKNVEVLGRDGHVVEGFDGGRNCPCSTGNRGAKCPSSVSCRNLCIQQLQLRHPGRRRLPS